MGTFSIWHWLVVLAVVVLVFGTKKLRNLGSDLGSALKGFKEGMKDSDADNATSQSTGDSNNPVIEAEVKNKTTTTAFKQAKTENAGFAPPPQNQETQGESPGAVTAENSVADKKELETVNIPVSQSDLNGSTKEGEDKISIQTKG